MPGPPEARPIPKDVQHYADLLDKQYPGNLSGMNITLSEAYLIYMTQHPNANAKLIYEEVVARLKAVGSIPKAIGDAVNAASGVIAGTGQAAVGGLTFHGGILGFLGDLTDPHFWIRLAEGAVGLILLAVGLNALLKQSTGIEIPKVIPV